MSRETRAMQDDDTANPGLLWVLEGEALWSAKAGAAGRACADCHGDAAISMKGVAARYPAFDAGEGRPVNLEQRINLLPHRSPAGAAARLGEPRAAGADRVRARQSRGLPIDVASDPRTQPFLDAGRATCERRQGQLNLSCTPVPRRELGRQLAGNVIPQAHPTGYPLYRLEWQSLGSLERRLRNCLIGIRAEPYAYGAPELVDLELFLMWRARGMLARDARRAALTPGRNRRPTSRSCRRRPSPARPASLAPAGAAPRGRVRLRVDAAPRGAPLSTIGGVGMWSVIVALPAVQAEFGVARSAASLPYTMTMIGFGLGGVLMGRLSDRFGIVLPVVGGAISLGVGYVAASAAATLWQFTLAQALFVGVASSATFAPLLADTSLWFTRRRGVAVAIFASGNYLAGTLWPPIVQHLIESVGWRQAYVGIAPALRGDHVAAHAGAEAASAPRGADHLDRPARLVVAATAGPVAGRAADPRWSSPA